jgi:hypothetical protein
MTYPDISSINMTDDLGNLLVYVNNDLTNGYFSPLVLGAFFLIVFIGGFIMQMRLSGRGRPDYSFATAGFLTTGLAVLMSMKTGLLSSNYLLICIAISILGVVWLILGREN